MFFQCRKAHTTTHQVHLNVNQKNKHSPSNVSQAAVAKWPNRTKQTWLKHHGYVGTVLGPGFAFE